MRLLLPASLSLLLLLPAAHAQLLNADDFFNDGAHSYLTNNIPEALKTVQTGLQQYPDDDHLKKLYEFYRSRLGCLVYVACNVLALELQKRVLLLAK